MDFFSILDGSVSASSFHGVPFRLGTTSFIVPADIKTNVQHLLGRVDDVELLFFEASAESDFPDTNTIAWLRTAAADHGLTYTVHLPIDIDLGHADGSKRSRGIRACRNIIQMTSALDPFAYVLHLSKFDVDFNKPDELEQWQDRTATALEALLRDIPATRTLAIENLNYPISCIIPMITTFDLSMCIDVGHLLCQGTSPLEAIERYLDRVRVVHLHGVEDGRDHRSLDHLQQEVLSAIVALLKRHGETPRVVTLEVFGSRALETSLGIMEEYL